MFSDTDVLKSSVATRIRCDEIFNSFIAIENLSLKKIENRLKVDEVTPMSLVSPFSRDMVYYNKTVAVCLVWRSVKLVRGRSVSMATR